jgi:cytochrome c
MWKVFRRGSLALRTGKSFRRFHETKSAIRAALPASTWLLAIGYVGLLLAGCGAKSEPGPVNFPGDPKRGMALIKQYGCGGCHLIPDVDDATGNVGPPLLHVGTRAYIAGFLSNSPENMSLWIQDPQQVLPGNAMPRMGVTQQDSRDITAFLYTLK